ncbi:energy transducer TonB [Opitutus terrae]|uniref:TonB family protein n=1 Tax=Opitutus terrae (strain DSM 11246 / JCM 15787 / PB90-1) TaxID=452637 RepID=B1ZXS6_OPITP|nr:energy transducer TonB [Opitutus terrae]ACB74298.1 TonB family protein [Opitutus terrae PB90-1]
MLLARIGLLALICAGLLAGSIARAATASAQPPEPPLVADGPALLREWSPPVYPPEQLAKKTGGMVTVRLIVDEHGIVTSARAMPDSDEAFVASALAAVRAWKFAPAIEEQKPAPCCLETLVAYSPARGQLKPSVVPPQEQTFSLPARTTPEPQSSPPGEYPSVLVDRKLAGAVRFGGVVTTDGRLIQPRIDAASHVEFVLPALQALERWAFKPAMQGDLAVRANVEAVMTFEALFDKPEEVLTANRITAPDGSPPPTAPRPTFVADPVWPIDALLRGEEGAATVEYQVTPTGRVRGVRVREASQPEFGAALAAAIEASGYGRTLGDPGAPPIALMQRVAFKAVPADLTESTDPIARLVIAMRAGQIGSAKGLDRKLAPIYRAPPAYPGSLVSADGGPKGRAEIEFVVDREGRVRLPRIVSATQPEFGWAAATAIAQWVFQPPTRGGQPVDVKVKIPFEFAAVTAPE